MTAVPPPILGPAANPAARNMHETALKAHADHSTALTEIKAAMLESLGEANREHTRDPALGLHNHTPLAIIAVMVLFHWQYMCTESDVFQLLHDLEKELTSLDDFDSHVGKLAKTLRTLVLAGTPVQTFVAYNHFKLPLSSFPAFDKHIDDYVTATPPPWSSLTAPTTGT
jgi:hypothetical protein